MCANDVLKSYHGRKIVQIESWRIMDLNQYIGSMNAKDCIYQNPKPLKYIYKHRPHLHLSTKGRAGIFPGVARVYKKGT